MPRRHWISTLLYPYRLRLFGNFFQFGTLPRRARRINVRPPSILITWICISPHDRLKCAASLRLRRGTAGIPPAISQARTGGTPAVPGRGGLSRPPPAAARPPVDFHEDGPCFAPSQPSIDSAEENPPRGCH